MSAAVVLELPPPADRARDFAHCRAFGHAWELTGLPAGMRPGPVWRHVAGLTCTRCQMVRADGLDAWGDVGSRRYRPPEGYSYPRGEAPSRGDFRLWAVTGERRRRRRRPADEATS